MTAFASKTIFFKRDFCVPVSTSIVNFLLTSSSFFVCEIALRLLMSHRKLLLYFFSRFNFASALCLMAFRLLSVISFDLSSISNAFFFINVRRFGDNEEMESTSEVNSISFSFHFHTLSFIFLSSLLNIKAKSKKIDLIHEIELFLFTFLYKNCSNQLRWIASVLLSF